MPPTQRDPWLDNVKMTLVTLVVIGHSWGLLAWTENDQWPTTPSTSGTFRRSC